MKRYRTTVLTAACNGTLVPTEAELAGTDGRGFESGRQHAEQIARHRIEEWQRHRNESGSIRGKYPEPAAQVDPISSSLPRGWHYTSIDQIAVVVRGASPRPAGDPKYFGGDIPWITVGSLTKDNAPYLREVREFVTERGKAASRYIKPGTFLLTNSGATLGVPKISLIGGCINDGSVALLFLPDNLKLYLWIYLSSLTPTLRLINQGAAQPNLNTTIVKSIGVPLPPLPEVYRIVAETERRLSIIDELSAAISAALNRADRLRQSILQCAFSGQLVPQNPDEELASVLLERIAAERTSAAPPRRKAVSWRTKATPAEVQRGLL